MPEDSNKPSDNVTDIPQTSSKVVNFIVAGLVAIGIVFTILIRGGFVTLPDFKHEASYIDGVLEDSKTNEGVKGAKIFLVNDIGSSTLTVDDGRFHLQLNKEIKKGTIVELTAAKSGYTTARVDVTVGSSTTFTIDPGVAAAATVISQPSREDPKVQTPVVVVGNGSPACTLYGEASSGGNAWNKDDACTIPHPELLDPNYHQSSFICCGGGATSPTTNANIPAGLELAVSGGYNWAVSSPQLTGDHFSIHTYCGPASSGGPGCNVRVLVIPHYRSQ